MKIAVRCISIGIGLSTLFISSCARRGELAVEHQVTGPVETNCYLIYDTTTREAALIDVGGPIDSLVKHIEVNGLEVKYIFATHVHMDHVEGVPEIQERFPQALLGYNRADYEDFLGVREWMAEHFPDMFEEMKKSPGFDKWFEYDMSIFKAPDIELADDQTFALGNLTIRTVLAPGHSRGSICFHVGDALFSGDVLFRRRVGRTDLQGGSKDAIAKSVRRLYTELPEGMTVFPGHGEFTTIGEEKLQNEEVTVDAATIKN